MDEVVEKLAGLAGLGYRCAGLCRPPLPAVAPVLAGAAVPARRRLVALPAVVAFTALVAASAVAA